MSMPESMALEPSGRRASEIRAAPVGVVKSGGKFRASATLTTVGIDTVPKRVFASFACFILDESASYSAEVKPFESDQ